MNYYQLAQVVSKEGRKTLALGKILEETIDYEDLGEIASPESIIAHTKNLTAENEEAIKLKALFNSLGADVRVLLKRLVA